MCKHGLKWRFHYMFDWLGTRSIFIRVKSQKEKKKKKKKVYKYESILSLSKKSPEMLFSL